MWGRKIFRAIGLERLSSTTTLKNVSTLMTGTVISAAIPILFAPIMSRIFSTESYGILGIYISITTMLGVLAYSHYSQAVMLEKEDGIARQIIWFTVTVSLLVALISLFVFLFLYFFTSVIADSSVGGWLFFVPLSVLLSGINTTLLVWANRVQKYKTLASNRVIQALSTVVIQISLGLIIKNETGLMIGLIFGQFLSVILLFRLFLGNNPHAIGAPAFKSFRQIAIGYKKLFIYSTPSEFINNLINQTPIFLLQKFAGTSYVGNYTFAQRMLGVPQQFLSSAIVEIFKQKASTAYNQTGSCRPVYVKTLKVLITLAIIPFTILAIFAPQIFSFVFGEQWHTAGVFAQFLSFLFFLRFVVSPLSYVYIVSQRLREDFILHILFLVVTTISFYIGDVLFEDKTYLILCYSIAYSLIYLIYLVRSYTLSKNPQLML